MRALVTGANGFVGSMLCRKLLQSGVEVRGLVRRTSDLSLLADVPIQQVVGSLEDTASLDAAANGVDVVYHVAAAVSDWGTWEYFHRTTVEGTRSILQAAVKNGVRRFVYISSTAVHSFINAQDMNEESPQLPTPFLYCQAKREAEALVQTVQAQGKIETVIVRPGDIYGPGDRVALLNMAKPLSRGLLPYIGGGKKLGAFTYVENLTDGILLAGTLPQAAGGVYILTDGIKMTWREYFERLTAVLGFPKPRLSVHPRLAYALASMLEGFYLLFKIQQRPPFTRYLVVHLSNDYHFSIARAARELGYSPQVGVDEAFRRTAAWLKEYQAGSG
jgi:nucleoside-diphosphate-sugar epimerase